jgi:hypothetical protein
VNDEDIKAVIATAFSRFEHIILSTSASTPLSPRMHQLVLKTLAQVRRQLETDPAYVEGIVRETKLRTREPYES